MRHDATAPDRSGAEPFSIEALVNGLSPVRSMRLRDGMMLSLAAVLVAAIAVALSMGVRQDLATGNPHWMFVLRAAVLVVLGLAAAKAALSAVTPGVGNSSPAAWKWLLAGAVLFPAGAAYVWLTEPVQTMARANLLLYPEYGLECLRISGVCAAVVAVVMTLWVRRGAPTLPNRAAWLIGLAAGALGAAAYSIHCTQNVLIYIGTWYSLAVAGCALAGRIILPRFLRW